MFWNKLRIKTRQWVSSNIIQHRSEVYNTKQDYRSKWCATVIQNWDLHEWYKYPGTIERDREGDPGKTWQGIEKSWPEKED